MTSAEFSYFFTPSPPLCLQNLYCLSAKLGDFLTPPPLLSKDVICVCPLRRSINREELNSTQSGNAVVVILTRLLDDPNVEIRTKVTDMCPNQIKRDLSQLRAEPMGSLK